MDVLCVLFCFVFDCILLHTFRSVPHFSPLFSSHLRNWYVIVHLKINEAFLNKRLPLMFSVIGVAMFVLYYSISGFIHLWFILKIHTIKTSNAVILLYLNYISYTKIYTNNLMHVELCEVRLHNSLFYKLQTCVYNKENYFYDDQRQA